MAEGVPLSALLAGDSPSQDGGGVPLSALMQGQQQAASAIPAAPASNAIPLSQLLQQQQSQAGFQPISGASPRMVQQGLDLTKGPELDPLKAQALDNTLGATANAIRATGETALAPLMPLTLPLRGAAGLASRAQGSSDQLIGKLPDNPGVMDYVNQVVPNITFLDVADFAVGNYLQSPDAFAAKMAAKGMAPGDALNLYQKIRDGGKIGGAALDFALDPLALTTFGQLNDAAKIAREQGLFKNEADVIAEHAAQGIQLDPNRLEDRMAIIQGVGQLKDDGRNMMTVRAPFSDKEIPINLPESVSGAIAKTAQKVTPDVIQNFAEQGKRSLDYRFGVPELDYAAAQNTFEKAQIAPAIKGQYLTDMAKLDFSPDEMQAVERLVENTPNLVAENIPASKTSSEIRQVVTNADGDMKVGREVVPTRQSIGEGMGVYDKDALREEMTKKFAPLTQDLGVNPERADALIGAAIRTKEANSDITGMQYAHGILDDRSVVETNMQNYLAHIPTPDAVRAVRAAEKGNISPADAFKQVTDKMGDELERTINTSTLSSFNSTRVKRQILEPIEQADKLMSEKYGVDGFYVRNPFIATATRWAQSEKMIADKKFLDTMVKYGIEPASREQRLALEARGWGPLNVPEFKGKTIHVNLDGIPTPVRLEDRLFAPELAAKVNHWIKPNEIGGNFAAFLGGYNKVFKSMALMSPGFHARNTIEDLFKYYANGGTLKNNVLGAKAALLPLLPASEASKTVQLGGKTYKMSELNEMLQGLKGMSSAHEIPVADALFSGKTFMQKAGDAIRNPLQTAKNVLKSTYELGEGGVHAMRGAQYFDLLDKGYSPQAAAFHTQNLMFDFRRTTPMIDKARTYWDPFIQHAIKTAFITPELLGKAPRAYNFFINNLPKYITAAMSDPVTDEYLKQMAPDYVKHRDPSASLLLPGDTMMASILKPPANGRWATFVTPEFGPGILKKFEIWDSSVMRSRMGFGPAMSALMTMVTGTGMNGKPIDADPSNPVLASRALRVASDAAAAAGFATPGAWNAVKQIVGLKGMDVLPSANMQLLQAGFGQFVRFQNIDKDYLFKTIALNGAYQDLVRQLPGALAKEAQGKTIPAFLQDYPTLRKLYQEAAPDKAQSLWQIYLNRNEDFMRSRAAMDGLTGQKTAVQVIRELKAVEETSARLNATHEAMTRAMLEHANSARAR